MQATGQSCTGQSCLNPVSRTIDSVSLPASDQGKFFTASSFPVFGSLRDMEYSTQQLITLHLLIHLGYNMRILKAIDNRGGAEDNLQKGHFAELALICYIDFFESIESVSIEDKAPIHKDSFIERRCEWFCYAGGTLKKEDQMPITIHSPTLYSPSFG